MNKGQTAVEYLLLVGSSVLLVGIVAWFIKTRVLSG